MARKYSSILFDLIQSLSKTEKRYLQLQCASYFKDKENKHLQLFQLLMAQKVHNDEELKEKIYGNSTSSNTYAQLKNYLYLFILRTLTVYDESHSIEIKIKSDLLKVRALYKRGLIKASKDMLNALHRSAKKLNDASLLLEIYSWQKKVAHHTFDIHFLEDEGLKINKEESDLLSKTELLAKLRNIYDELFLIRMKYDNKLSKEQITDLNKLVSNLPNHEGYEEDYDVKKWLLNIKVYHSYLLKDYEAYYTTNKFLYDLMKSNVLRVKENPKELISQVARVILSCNQLHRYNDAPRYFEEFIELSQLKGIGILDKRRCICSYYINKLIYLASRGDNASGINLIQQFENQYPTSFYKPYLSNFFFLFSHIHFGAGDYDGALKYADRLLNLKIKLRKDFQANARCLSLICHYELGNNQLVESLIRSTMRYLKIDFKDVGFESQLFKFIKELINPVLRKKEKKALFTNFKAQIISEYGELNTIKDRIVLNTGYWLESKLSNTSIAQQVKTTFEAYLVED